jgi:hypothetical protein
MAFGAVVTLLNLVLCLMVGARLLRGGFGRQRSPELALAIYFLASAFLSTVCQGLVYGGLVDPSLALPDRTGRFVLGLGVLGMALGGAAVCVFTWLTFRRDSGWARLAAVAGSLLAIGGWTFEALHEGFAVSLHPGPGHWAAWAGRTGPMVWVGVETFRYWAVLRRRLRFGLAEPVVVNRFLLWGIWSAATFVNLAADLIARVLYMMLAGTTTELVMEVVTPVVIGTMSVTMVLGVVSAITLFLTFFPTAAYRRWLESRGASPRDVLAGRAHR